ncbi:TadE/TadG family type IV pilus assembly protein [Novosphingobium clariflavum]|uniref:TadE/TadG family type IV pilus assembly protein n=1 Tax=Novosphingobium clariflavum TaxID=2029884 RepID=A0ABV6S4A8_9SPHN|nr:TadE/TadG family type IV pilus assembly protein [Novosphingobium clariflavum]
MIARRLRRDTRGATLIEFAIVGPVLIFMLIGLIETGRFLWSQHVLKDVAYATVRCMSVSADCATSQTRLAYAANRAANEGLRVAASNVTITENTACKGLTGANRVAITIPYSSALTGFIPAAPTTLSAEACFPVLPSGD